MLTRLLPPALLVTAALVVAVLLYTVLEPSPATDYEGNLS